MGKERYCTWFVEPIGEHSNEVLVKGINDLAEEDLLAGVVCDDGEKHSLIRCPWSYVAKAQKSRATDKNLSFRVWYKQGNGAIKFWKFDGAKPKVVEIPRHWKVIRVPEESNK